MRPPLPDELFEPLAARIAEVSGIRVPVSKRWLLAARVDDRMRALAEDEIAAYVRNVLAPSGAAELGQLVEALRVGETQFFRHQGQLRAIRRVALPEIVARLERERRRRVRVWSAGCATGEEAYTLAMMLEDELPRAEGWTHEVLATDMSERALAAAREGRYPAGSVHGVPPQIASWAFERRDDDVIVTERAREGVRFEHRNLLSESYPRGLDLVLCRNVLIYFDRATQREVLARLAAAVVEGGYLALGYAERLDGPALPLSPIRTEDGLLYRRREGVVGVVEAGTGAGTDSDPRAESRTRTESSTGADAGRGAPGGQVRLTGVMEGEEGERVVGRVVGGLLEAERPVLDVAGLLFADEGVGRVLARAAHAIADQGRTLRIAGASAGTLRFLRRHGVVPPAEAGGGGRR